NYFQTIYSPPQNIGTVLRLEMDEKEKRVSLISPYVLLDINNFNFYVATRCLYKYFLSFLMVELTFSHWSVVEYFPFNRIHYIASISIIDSFVSIHHFCIDLF